MASLCNDTNKKIIEVEFDSGSLKQNDVWYLCKDCNQKKIFEKFRIRVSHLRGDKHD